MVRRNLKRTGRSSMYIQDSPVSREKLAECMSLLFDLHGQHSHENLLRKENHRKYLDRFAGIEDEVLAFNKSFLELSDLKKSLAASLSSQKDRETRLEILRYTVDELDKAALKSGESADLELESARLSSFERLSAQVNGALELLSEGEENALSLGRKLRASLEAAAGIDESLAPLQARMDSLYYEAEDLAGELRSYNEGLKFDPARLEAVEERLALLQRLMKKYEAEDEDGLLAKRDEAAAEIERLSNFEENRDKLNADIGTRDKDIARKAAALSAKRKEAGAKLGEKISAILGSLGMPKARFAVSVQAKGDGRLVVGPWGADEIEFMISANAGEPLKELAKIASGGELSRVMLAIKTVLADADSIETLVFDEIDTGIGGEVALAVGEHLSKLAKIKQLFCITHLASIAVRADNHLKVEKKLLNGSQGERTVTTVSALDGEGRRKEIARMLAGDAGGAAALAHADALLARYQKHGKA
jgi:DNA repair protein RecN (Recombination protein N)